MNKALSIRKMSEDDFKKLSDLDQKIQQSEPWTESHFKAEFEKPYSETLILTDDETDEEVFGYVCFWLLEGEGEILNIGVDLDRRGMGWGEKLARSAIKLMAKADVKKIRLNVRKSNEAAIQLYHKLGFSIGHIRKDFYQDREDAYEMLLFLEAKDFFY